jgi:lysozyme family protein
VSDAAFEKAMTLTLGHEGGWYDGSDPRDPNPTMYGVTQKTYDAYRTEKKFFPPSRSVQLIEQHELQDIYSQYWYGTCDQVAETCPLTAYCLFDIAINAGQGTARKLLQRSLDLAEDGDIGDIADDGKLGPQTYAALAHYETVEHNAPNSDELLCLWLLMERVRYYNTVADTPRLRPNLKNWIARTVDFYERFVRV